MSSLVISLLLGAIYLAFWLWYGGNGKPMSKEAIEEGLRTLQATDPSEHGQSTVQHVRELLANDDGKEFVMQNLVRYRPKALYPPGYTYSDDPREADKRYGKAIMGDLLRHGNLLVFVGRKAGNFITPEGADNWHYVARVRYRSRRDFLRFAIASSQADKFVHKWAAIEKTHVFPVKPIVSLITVRVLVAMSLLAAGLILRLAL